MSRELKTYMYTYKWMQKLMWPLKCVDFLWALLDFRGAGKWFASFKLVKEIFLLMYKTATTRN